MDAWANLKCISCIKQDISLFRFPHSWDILVNTHCCSPFNVKVFNVNIFNPNADTHIVSSIRGRHPGEKQFVDFFWRGAFRFLDVAAFFFFLYEPRPWVKVATQGRKSCLSDIIRIVPTELLSPLVRLKFLLSGNLSSLLFLSLLRLATFFGKPAIDDNWTQRYLVSHDIF